MIGRLQFWRLLGAMAIFAALSCAPQVANAHAGHSHAHHGAAAAAEPAPAAQDAATQPAHQVVMQELTQADPVAPCVDHGCVDRGCCSNGPCTGCHSFVIVPVPVAAPPTTSSLVRLNDQPPHLGGGQTRLRRPPKSFV
jgi:RES domain-containing protein